MAELPVRTTVEKNIIKLVYPSGKVSYQVYIRGQGDAFLQEVRYSLEDARKLKADHLKKHPELVPMTEKEAKARFLKRSKLKKVPGTQFISEYKERPGTYSIRIKRAKKRKGQWVERHAIATGLENAKKKEKKLITEVEKIIKRDISTSVHIKPVAPVFKRAVADVRGQMKKWNKRGYFPQNILVDTSTKYNLKQDAEGANRQLTNLVREAGLINRDKLQALTPKYMEAIEEYKKYKGDKTQLGVKKAMLDKVGLSSQSVDVASFRNTLNSLGLGVAEEFEKKGTKQRKLAEKLSKASASNIEEFLSGRKLGPLQITGKKGSFIDKMHLGPKAGEVTVGEMGFGSAKLNQMLGTTFTGSEIAQGPEKHRASLDKHIDKIIKKYKGRPDAMYEIGKGPDTVDQRKFKAALQKEFGKTQGKIPLKQYLDKIINTEVQLMGHATDGLITTRRVDPITLERMIPPSNVDSTRTISTIGKVKDLTTLKELGLEKQRAGRNIATPRLRDFGEASNLAFESAKINIANFKNKITPYQMKSVVNSIDKMLGEGLQNQAYENISKLSKQCRLLRAKGGRVDFATGGPCVAAKRAIQNLDNSEFIKIGSRIEEGATGVLGKIRGAATNFLKLAGRVGTKAAPLAALAGVGAAIEPLVKQFVIDDPNTYLTDENQMKGMLLATLEGEPPKVDEEILKWQYPGLGAATAAGAIPGAGEVYKARRSGVPLDKSIGPLKGVGKTRAALGISGVLGKALGASFSPLAAAATLPISVAAQREGGTEWGDIATDPGNWMAPAFASTGAEMATKGIQNPMLLKALRLGMSPRTLSVVSRRFGLPGLAVSAGMWGYDKWKNRSINDED